MGLACGFSTGSAADEGPKEALGEPAPWRAVDATTGQISDVGELEQLARDFPHSGSVRLRLLNAYAGAGDMDGLYESVLWLTSRGYAFSTGAEAQIAGLFDGERAERLAGVFSEDAEVVAVSEVAAVVPAKAGLVEDVVRAENAMHEGESVFFASSVTGSSLWLGAMGEWFERPYENARNTSGIAATDPALCAVAASGGLFARADNTGLFSGIIWWCAHHGEEKRIAVPASVTLSDLFLAENYDLFASDPLNGGVYRVDGETDALETLIPRGTFRSPQGLVTSADNTTLYISDYRYGLAMIDLETRAVTRVDTDEPILLDGIDALLRHGSELIAVQNGTSPMRIVALQLSEDGKRITSHRVLEQAHPEWTEPLGATISGETLYYIGNGQWHLYDEGGVLKAGAEPQPTQIRKLELGPPR